MFNHFISISSYMLFILGLTPNPLFADTIVLTNGQSLEGDVADQTPEFINVVVKFGTIRIATQKIERIEKDTPEKIAAKLEKEAADKELTDRMMAEGKVLYKGRWVLEGDKKKDEVALAAAKKKKQQERAEAEAKKVAAAAKKKVDDQKRFADLQKQRQLANDAYNNSRYRNSNNQRPQRSGRNSYNSSRNYYGNNNNYNSNNYNNRY